MEKRDKEVGERKFMALDESKRDRIINAAMNEFRYGYKRASTDTIVKKAGISKGLLFHYFGTKENLFEFLINFAMEKVQRGHMDMLDYGGRDLLEGIWQMALQKKDISDRYPHIYEFAYAVHAHWDDLPGDEIFLAFWEKQEALNTQLIEACDTGMLREDIDPQKATAMLGWTVSGFFEYANAKKAYSKEGWEDEDYEIFLKELRSYLDILKLCFYKN